MNKPKITEEQLQKLMRCLVEEFDKANGAQSNKLSNHQFLTTNDMSCGKRAGLNYEFPAVMNPEKIPVTMRSSLYDAAAATLVSRGTLEYSEKTNLRFAITEKGHFETKSRVALESRTKSQKLLDFCTNNKLAVSLAIAIIGLITAVVKAATGSA